MAARLSANGSAYRLAGPADAPLLALIHGLGLNRGVWDGFIAPLSRRYRVLAYDLYGHGESAPPPGPATLALYAGQLRELLDELAIARCLAVGFSLGGMINRRLAMDSPGRVDALAILNSPHERDPALQRRVEQQARDSRAGPAATLDAAIERWFTADFIRAQPAVIERVRGWVLANDTHSYAEARLVLATGVTELIRPPPPLALPALVMTCADDSGSTPAMSAAIAAEIDGAELIVVPGLRHLGLLERPALFAGPILEFAARIYPRQRAGN